MRPLTHVQRMLPLAAVWIVLSFSIGSAQAQSSSASDQNAKTNLNDPERQQAMQLYEQHKLPEAAALLEKVVARYPEDVVAREHVQEIVVAGPAREQEALAARCRLMGVPMWDAGSFIQNQLEANP